MFIPALFAIANLEAIQVSFSRMMGYNLAIKKNELLTYSKTWMISKQLC